MDNKKYNVRFNIESGKNKFDIIIPDVQAIDEDDAYINAVTMLSNNVKNNDFVVDRRYEEQVGDTCDPHMVIEIESEKDTLATINIKHKARDGIAVYNERTTHCISKNTPEFESRFMTIDGRRFKVKFTYKEKE